MRSAICTCSAIFIFALASSFALRMVQADCPPSFSCVSRNPHAVVAAAQLKAPARQTHGSKSPAPRGRRPPSQSPDVMQLNGFACNPLCCMPHATYRNACHMPSFMRRPIWRMLYRHTPCRSIASALAARAGAAPSSGTPSPSPQLRGGSASEPTLHIDATQ